ncbi:MULTISPECIES: glycosyltransferase family 9 protein [Paraburkholderia]|uniref:glycosyltransferase family 9 protein n=1 Tax=Paraburkholderia TaxID=1822464 RepID=UPI00225209C5|nr:hypothetical protein [Paraburkholderia aspalathi]MDN7169145.1 hypothetical protein [Paraburkholderia sp. SECH2]MDQ6397633.1 hypothetical protein [Paraburkholderia aspalathi]
MAERVALLQHASAFVGMSSGLAWLAWACRTPVVMISGFTLPYNEFQTPYRVFNVHTCTGAGTMCGTSLITRIFSGARVTRARTASTSALR